MYISNINVEILIQYCSEQSGCLAEITSKEEDEQILSILENGWYWLGLFEEEGFKK